MKIGDIVMIDDGLFFGEIKSINEALVLVEIEEGFTVTKDMSDLIVI